MLQKIVVTNEKAVVERLTAEIEKCARSAISERGVFRVGLSGGSVLNYLCEAIPSIVDTQLEKWRFFFCDERFVAESDADSTFGAYRRTLLPRCPGLQLEQFVCIEVALSLAECAKDYEEKILKEFQLDYGSSVPQFDLLLLGMGPDGHTCSLFPGHSLLTERGRIVAPISDSPKPPAERVTMTFPLINAARCCIFAMCGAGKADMVQKVFVQKQNLPAAMVAPQHGDLICICDEAAGKYLQNS